MQLVEKYNGWENRECVNAFERYAKVCFKEYGDKVKYWQVINEQNLMIRVDERMNINEPDPWKADKIRAQMVTICFWLMPLQQRHAMK